MDYSSKVTHRNRYFCISPPFFYKFDAYFSLKKYAYVGILQLYGTHIWEWADIRRGRLNERIVVYEFRGADIRRGHIFGRGVLSAVYGIPNGHGRSL